MQIVQLVTPFPVSVTRNESPEVCGPRGFSRNPVLSLVNPLDKARFVGESLSFTKLYYRRGFTTDFLRGQCQSNEMLAAFIVSSRRNSNDKHQQCACWLSVKED